jgi:hypothetical protein
MVTVNAYDEQVNTSLADGSSITVSGLNSGQDTAELVLTQVDNNAGGQPATYDLEQRVRPESGVDYLVFDREEDTQTYAFVDDIRPAQLEIEVTNRSGGATAFRLRLTIIGDI